MPTHDSEPLTLLVGPTAAGKSELALELAEAAGAEILSLDSMQVYRGLDVGTAKPGPEDQARVPHHLIDLVDPPERYHVQRYLEDATAARETVRARGRRALFVGGTGFYLKALTHGLFAGAPHDEDLRRELNRRAAEEGSGVLHRELEAVDPAAAARIHPNDAKRVVRGLEVYRSGAGRLSELQREWAVGGGRARRLVGVAPAPDRLEARIRERTEVMLEGGWIDEVRPSWRARASGPPRVRPWAIPRSSPTSSAARRPPSARTWPPPSPCGRAGSRAASAPGSAAFRRSTGSIRKRSERRRKPSRRSVGADRGAV